MSDLKFVDDLPSTGVGRPGQLKQKIEDWIPGLLATPGKYAEVEHPERQLYGRANSIRHIFNDRHPEDGGKFKVATRRTKPPEGEDWDGSGTIYVGFFTAEQLAAEEAASANGNEDLAAGAPEPVTV